MIYNNKTIDNIIEKLPITRLGEYIHMNKKILFKCKICNHEWLKTPNHVVYRKQLCPICNTGSKIEDVDSIDLLLKQKDLERIGEFTGCNEKIKVCCKKDGYVWDARISNLKKIEGNGCPRCSGKEKYTNERVDYLLKDKSIFRIGDYVRAKDKLLFGCKKCKNEWLASPSRIINDDRGCPCCYKKSENKLKDILLSKNVKYIPQYNIKINGKDIFVDFYINDKTLIERNGEQHYKPIRFGGMPQELAEQRFIKQKERDSILNKYCIDNGINLIIIPYWYNECQIQEAVSNTCL